MMQDLGIAGAMHAAGTHQRKHRVRTRTRKSKLHIIPAGQGELYTASNLESQSN